MFENFKFDLIVECENNKIMNHECRLSILIEFLVTWVKTMYQVFKADQYFRVQLFSRFWTCAAIHNFSSIHITINRQTLKW